MRLTLKNNLTKAEMEFDVTNKMTSGLFYAFDITLSGETTEGEYTYTLYGDKNEVIATGLAQIGDYKPETSAYTENNQQQFITYNG